MTKKSNGHDEAPRTQIPDGLFDEALKSVERAKTPPAEETVIEVEGAEAAAPEDSDAETELLRETLKETLEAMKEAQAETKKAQAEIAAERDRTLRLTADFDNYRRRQEREMEEARKTANRNILRDLLPVFDNLERALVHVDRSAMPESLKSLVEGVDMVLKQGWAGLAKNGVTPYESKGTKFDPEKHEAVAQRESSEFPPDHVAEEYQRGYLIHGRLLRPASVVVTRAPAASTGTPANEEERPS